MKEKMEQIAELPDAMRPEPIRMDCEAGRIGGG